MEVVLMDLDSRNVVDHFATEGEALAFVRDAIAEHGLASVATWSLGRADRSAPPVSGQDLTRRALSLAHA